jgi:uncharacterized protein YdhG (YjbR/CyaY superfamily)
LAAPASAPSSIGEYIAASPPAVRPILREIRRTIRAAAPGAREVISYRMPAFKQRGILVYFAAFKGHVGLYPPVSGDARLEKALEPYTGPKGNLRFPLDRPIPYGLIGRIVRLRVEQDQARVAARKRKRRRAASAKPGGPRRAARARRG